MILRYSRWRRRCDSLGADMVPNSDAIPRPPPLLLSLPDFSPDAVGLAVGYGSPTDALITRLCTARSKLYPGKLSLSRMSRARPRMQAFLPSRTGRPNPATSPLSTNCTDVCDTTSTPKNLYCAADTKNGATSRARLSSSHTTRAQRGSTRAR